MTVPAEWKRSTPAVNRFIKETSDFKRIKIGDKHTVEFRFNAHKWLLTEDGDLFLYGYAEKLHLQQLNHRTNNGITTAVYRFSITKGYWTTKRRELVAKDLMWAAFGRCDLPAKHRVVISDGIPERIGISNLEIRRKM